MKSHAFIIFIITFVLFFAFPGFSKAERGTDSAFRSTAYPLPRFVSLNATKVYVRAGPGERFPIKWEYRSKGLPIEIILEYEHWRKIRDHEGDEGWIHSSLLTGRRTGLTLPLHETQVAMRKKPEEEARLVAYMEPMVVVNLLECIPGWCYISVSGFKGWSQRKYIWGVYENENFD